METNRPASRPPSSDEQVRLEAARGDLRDALGSVRNLAQLLHSMRVGPKAISAVLPAVHDPVEHIEGSVRALLDVVAARLPSREATDELLAYVAPRARELSTVLADAMHKPLNARRRLHLEEAVTRLSRELDAARALVDLFDDAVRGSATRVDLAEIVREAAQPRETGSAGTVEVTVAPGIAGEVLINPRVAVVLLGMGARLVAQLGGATPHVSGRPGSRTLEISAQPGEGETLILAAPPLVDPSLACAGAAADVAGTRLAWDEERKLFSLDLA